MKMKLLTHHCFEFHFPGMRGRLIWQSSVLILEGALVITFAHAETLALSLGILIMFSVFVQAAEGSTYG
jgi:NNP family nitrate/nitrite transporter-like MFS transporter